MYVTTYLRIPKGHEDIDFVDITTDADTELFIDPCLIERGRDPLSREAAEIIADFADQMYADMRTSRWNNSSVFDEAHEVNETKLGYGHGHNGKGKTPEGMRDSLKDLCDLATKIPTISCVQDIPVFVQDFAEDCMSDLLTNILRRILTQFTADQMQRYGIEPDGYHEIRSWDREKHDWAWSQEPFWRVASRKILLVPKGWVRKHFLFKTHQYLSLVILEHMRDDPRYRDLSKRIMLQSLEREIPHWEYEEVTRYTLAHPDALSEYHRRLPLHYNKAYGCMSDEALDKAVYVRRSRRNAG